MYNWKRRREHDVEVANRLADAMSYCPVEYRKIIDDFEWQSLYTAIMYVAQAYEREITSLPLNRTASKDIELQRTPMPM